MIVLEQLPGGDLIQRGLADYAEGRVTAEACLLAVGWSRLQRGGVSMPERVAERFVEPEMQLYRILCTEAGDAYSRYNSLLRRLISFEQTLEQRKQKEALA